MEMFCGYCGYFGEMVFVHSHYQCPRCKNNIAPCCEGENMEESNDEDTGNSTQKNNKDSGKKTSDENE